VPQLLAESKVMKEVGGVLNMAARETAKLREKLRQEEA
jgi:hypothetical protein